MRGRRVFCTHMVVGIIMAISIVFLITSEILLIKRNVELCNGGVFSICTQAFSDVTYIKYVTAVGISCVICLISFFVFTFIDDVDDRLRLMIPHAAHVVYDAFVFSL